MPLDITTQRLTVAQADFAAALHLYFRDHTFTADRAGLVVGRSRTSAATMLSLLVTHGACWRVKYGIYSMVDPDADRPVVVQPALRPKPVVVAIEESAAIEAPGPITDLSQALAWLTRRGVSIVPNGGAYIIEERSHATAEQLIAIAESRRTYRDRYPMKPERRFGDLPSAIPKPTSTQRMVKR